MKCAMCGSKKLTKSMGDYVYDANGLAVTLVGISIVRCGNCGDEAVEIPRIAELDRVIAGCLIGKSSPLEGTEIRFLRKFLGFSGEDYARVLGVDPSTLSRWENDKQPIASGHDHLVRTLAARHTPIEDYALFDALKSIKPERAGTKKITLQPTNKSWKAAA